MLLRFVSEAVDGAEGAAHGCGDLCACVRWAGEPVDQLHQVAFSGGQHADEALDRHCRWLLSQRPVGEIFAAVEWVG